MKDHRASGGNGRQQARAVDVDQVARQLFDLAAEGGHLSCVQARIVQRFSAGMKRSERREAVARRRNRGRPAARFHRGQQVAQALLRATGFAKLIKKQDVHAQRQPAPKNKAEPRASK